VTIVERNTDVIDLLAPLLPHDGFLQRGIIRRFVVSDFWDFIHDDTATRYDHIIVDLWVSSSGENKLRIFPEAVYTRYQLQEKYPEAAISLHGFVTLSDIKVVDQEVVDWAIKHGAWERS
jgi:hypothetical protein